MEECVHPLPEYDNPPVNEVVFGVQFDKLSGFKAPHVGVYWDRIGKDNYPEIEERPILPHIIEQERKIRHREGITVSDFLPLPRILFINRDKKNLIQLQEDRFLQNWRKVTASDEYPRYRTLYPKFEQSLQKFTSSIKEMKLGELSFDQYELTYVNHIPRGQGWDNLSDIDKVFSEIQCRTGKKFLPETEDLTWCKTYIFPEHTGRLHVSFRLVPNKETKEQMMVLDLTARGFSAAMDNWFNKAHEWIVRGFAELTSETIQKSYWKKK